MRSWCSLVNTSLCHGEDLGFKSLRPRIKQRGYSNNMFAILAVQNMEVAYFKQDTNFSCGPAVIQMILAFFGIHQSEGYLQKKLESDEKKGTDHMNMISYLLKKGLYCYANNDSTFKEVAYFLDKKIPVVVNYLEPEADWGHYAVVLELNKNNIILNDPWHGERFSMRLDEFEERWQSGDGKHKKWILAVSKSDLQMGKQYVPNV